MKRALVTGGAGLIGSHVADLLQREGWTVRILDNLEPQTHRKGKPAWIRDDVEFIEGDVVDRKTITAALQNIDVVFHQAAYGGYMPEIAKYVEVNSFGTAQMLEIIREQKLPVKKSSSPLHRRFTAKARRRVRSTDWFFQMSGQSNNFRRAIGPCIVLSVVRSRKARRHQNARRLVAKQFTA